MDAARSTLIDVAADILAAGLADMDALCDGHGLGPSDLALVAALAEKRAAGGNHYVIKPGLAGEALARALDAAAMIIGGGYTTTDRYKAACLAERGDADDLAKIIAKRALKYGARSPSPPPPVQPDWKSPEMPASGLLSADEGGVLPSADRHATGRQSTPDTPSGATHACFRGRHRLGEINPHGAATCLDCGLVVVAALPGSFPILSSGGNAPINTLQPGSTFE